MGAGKANSGGSPSWAELGWRRERGKGTGGQGEACLEEAGARRGSLAGTPRSEGFCSCVQTGAGLGADGRQGRKRGLWRRRGSSDLGRWVGGTRAGEVLAWGPGGLCVSSLSGRHGGEGNAKGGAGRERGRTATPGALDPGSRCPGKTWLVSESEATGARGEAAGPGMETQPSAGAQAPAHAAGALGSLPAKAAHGSPAQPGRGRTRPRMKL